MVAKRSFKQNKIDFFPCDRTKKLRGAENWIIWKFAVRNLLREIEKFAQKKAEQLNASAIVQQKAFYKLKLKE